MDFESKQPIYRIGQDDVVVNKRGEYTIGFKLIEPEIFSNSKEDYEALHDLYMNILYQLPNYSVMHKQDWFFIANYQPDPKFMKDFLSTKFEFKFNQKPFKKHESYLFFTKTTKNITKRSTKSSLLAQNIVSPKLINENIYNDFKGAVNAIEKVINRSGLCKVVRLTREDYLPSHIKNGLLNQYFNLSKKNVFADFDFTDGLKVGNKRVAIYPISDLSQYPDHVSPTKSSHTSQRFPFSFMYELGLGLDTNHIYNQYIFKDDNDVTQKALVNKGKTINAFSRYSKKNEKGAEEIREFTNNAVDDKLIVRHHCNVTTWAERIEDLSEAGGLVESAFKTLGFTAKQELFDLGVLFWGGVPGNGADIPADLTGTMFSEQACCYTINETAYSDSATAKGIKLTDRINKIPIYVDLNNEPREKQWINNYNKFIIGSSGSGKSALTNEIVHSNIIQGNRCVIIDRGNSYKRTHAYLNYINNDDSLKTKAEYFEYSEKDPLTFNPFHISSIEELNHERVLNVMSLIFSLWMQEKPTKAQESILEQTIRNYYQNCFEQNISLKLNSFYEFLEAYANDLQKANSTDLKYFDFDNLRTVLRRYYKGGLYEHLLNAETSIDILDTPLIIFELDSIRDNETLLGIVTMMIMNTYISVLYKAPATQIKTLILDEAWKALANPQMAVFINWCVRTLRKHEGELITITQELQDLVDSATIKNALIGSMGTKIIMDISGYKGSVDFVTDLLGLTELEKEMVNSLNKNIPPSEKFREAVFKFGTAVTRVFCVRYSDQQLAAYNTNANEVAEMVQLEKKHHGNMELAIEQFVENKNK